MAHSPQLRRPYSWHTETVHLLGGWRCKMPHLLPLYTATILCASALKCCKQLSYIRIGCGSRIRTDVLQLMRLPLEPLQSIPHLIHLHKRRRTENVTP